MQIALNRLPKSTIELTITIPWEIVQKQYVKSLDETVSEIELPGFRKGKAPPNLVEDKIGKSKIFENVVRNLIPEVYSQAVKDQDIKPIASPKIEVVSAEENKDWQIKALTCERPKVELGNYKDEIAKNNAKAKIWVPGKDVATKVESQSPQKQEEFSLDKALSTLLGSVRVDVPDLLIEDEVNRSLAKLVDQTQGLGLTTQQYLAAKGLTQESIKLQYQKQAQDSLALEFALDEIADTEKITVSEEEINSAIEKTPDPKTKEALKNDSYFLASILRRQKTFDYLKSL